jgi:multidrug efflux pump subunit AcrA (membrane-fusion protein)
MYETVRPDGYGDDRHFVHLGLETPDRVVVSWQFSILAAMTLTALVAAAAGLVWIPWQQSVVGSGKVIVLSPMQRPQNLEASIKARLAKWHVQEGDVVQAGQMVAELAEVDVKYLDDNQVVRMEAQRKALEDQLEAGAGRIESLTRQIESLVSYREISIASAAQKVLQTQQKVKQKAQGLDAATQNLTTTMLNYDRTKVLVERGIKSQRDLELNENYRVKAETEKQKAVADVEVARQDQAVAELERSKVGAELDAKISATEAYLAEAREKVAKTESTIQKLDIDLASLRARVSQREIRAPIAGRVVRLLKVGATETVKQGDVLAVLAPDTPDRAVELFVSGNDAPLVTPGRHVRLQFAGWPALQFSGWPSVAIGTFGGRVTVVDAVDDGAGRFRILVIPDKKTIETFGDAPWPDPTYLRPGAKVSGWIMLDVVSLGFELWRQFNGFAPALDKVPVGKPKGPKAAKKK